MTGLWRPRISHYERQRNCFDAAESIHMDDVAYVAQEYVKRNNNTGNQINTKLWTRIRSGKIIARRAAKELKTIPVIGCRHAGA